MPGTLSAVVVSYNRAAVIGTCLRALRFADEVIVVDKSSTDGTAEIAARHADRVITVPWSPTVEDTRAFAVAQASGDWILCLDDDECLDPRSAAPIRAAIAAAQADIYCLPLKHYILGLHDPAAYYWPEHHPRLFRRGAVRFVTVVHGGIRLCSEHVAEFPADSGVVIHHLSHRDVAEWVDKCNRYTARPDRVRAEHAGHDLAAFAHGRVDHWQARSKDAAPGGYPAAVALLRAVYDVIDRLKTWEEEQDLDGGTAFASVCAALDATYANAPDAPERSGRRSQGCPDRAPAQPDAAQAALRARVAQLRQHCEAATAEAARWSRQAAHWQQQAGHWKQQAEHREQEAQLLAARLDAELAAARQQAEHLQQGLRLERERLAAIESSTFWRATAGARRLADRAKRLGRRR